MFLGSQVKILDSLCRSRSVPSTCLRAYSLSFEDPSANPNPSKSALIASIRLSILGKLLCRSRICDIWAATDAVVVVGGGNSDSSEVVSDVVVVVVVVSELTAAATAAASASECLVNVRSSSSSCS